RRRALDPRGQHRLAPHVWPDHDMGIGQVSTEPGQLTERRIHPRKSENDIVRVRELWGQRRQNESVVSTPSADHTSGFGRPEVRRVHRWLTALLKGAVTSAPG